MLFVLGPISIRNFIRLLGIAPASISSSLPSTLGVFLLRARWASSTITQVYLRARSISIISLRPRVTRPCETRPMRLGHLPKPFNPSAGYSKSFSSIQALPVHLADGICSKFISSSCHCSSKGLGARTKIGPPSGSSRAIKSAAIAS